MRADQVDERLLQLDHLLPRSWPGVLDVPRQGQGARTEVHGREGLARHPDPVDHRTHPSDVLEVEVRRIVEVHVRLGGGVDD